LTELYIGLMSGTSMNALDAVLVDFEPQPPRLFATHTEPLSGKLRQALLELCQLGNGEIHKMAQLDVELGRAFATVVQTLLQKSAVTADQVRAIGSHGQTIRHVPDGPVPYTLQIGDPNAIAEITGITTVADFRRRDIAAGGQGAPLVPAFHEVVFRSLAKDRVVLNIGGIANISLLPRDRSLPIRGFDTGPGNVLMDIWASIHLHRPFDEEGAWAASGTVNDKLLSLMLADPYFALDPPKSTGREYFNRVWLKRTLSAVKAGLPPVDVQATLCELTAASVALAIAAFGPTTEEVLVCGGGVHNAQLVQRLQAWMTHCRLASTGEYGIAPDWVEAAAFAWLAKQTLEGKPGNVPSVTGARREVVLGAIYPAGKLP
jgi:anhydro-N-acetylmuramic acid kinase